MSSRIGDIEILRGFAVLFVVLHHACTNLFTWDASGLSRFYAYFGGWFGVDLFFAISGFVIARSLVPRLQSSATREHAIRTILAFWVRRAWRLWPAAWLWLGIILFASIVFNNAGAFGSFRSNFEATVVAVLQVANLRFAEVFMQQPYGASFHYWSLSLEEQFYLMFPLVVLLSRRFLPYVLVALILFQFFLTRTPMLMAFRTDALALGVLIALWSRHSSYELFRPAFLRHWRLGTALTVAVFVFMGALGSDQLHMVSIRIGMIALLSALLVWIASYNEDFLLRPGVFKRVMVWMGSRSYAIYLIHVPAFFFVRETFSRLDPEVKAFNGDFFWPFALSALLLILLLSELNYRYVEAPLRRKGGLIAERIGSAGGASFDKRAAPARLPEV
jgi:peptidoglycan/LPS O-acetylase OafA/YrhL